LPTFALDTATPSPSLALVAGREPIAELWLAPTRDGGRRVLQAAHGLLGASGVSARDLDRVVVGVGPGGFTGLRIGVATALGLGQALGIPVVGASSLEGLAVGIGEVAGEGALVAPLIDARRGEVFAAAYRAGPGGALEEVMAPGAVRPAALAADLSRLAREGGPAWLGGDGVEAARPELAGPLLRALPAGSVAGRQRAANLVRRVASGAVRPAVPTYLRLPDAEVNRRRAEASEAPAA
jgi:tRNA threonylcarbamoyladenosine biosynthesis protein TsaB